MKASFAADVSAPRKARSYLASELEGRALPTGVTLDKIILTASELVTNAVQAGATNVEISVHVAERRLDLVVSDDAEGWPTPVRAAAHDTAGRGLTIVEQLADSWDVGPQRVGKAVTVSWVDRKNHRIDSGS
jgi:anti-sigma regulatory factor (Ser/Thr protein kinase)